MTTMRRVVVCCLLWWALVTPRRIDIIDGKLELDDIGILDLNDQEHVEALYLALFELCDTYQTCSTSTPVPAQVQPFLGCCVPCNCSDECFVVGNCCRDKVGNPRRTANWEIVSKNGEVCSMVHPIDSEDITYSYLLVAQCHPMYEGEAINKCLNPSNTTLQDLVPVYSDQTGLSYRNIHCAHCNNQTESKSFIPWKVELACDIDTQMQHLNELKLTIGNDCSVSRFPPDETQTSKTCYRKTGASECEKARYRTLCDNLRMGYSYMQLQRYMCGYSIREKCILCSYSGFLQNTGMREFFYSSLINSEVLKTAIGQFEDGAATSSPGTERICPAGESFVFSEERCQRLVCSPSQITIQTDTMNCVDLYTQVRGVCLDYRISVTLGPEAMTELNLIDLVKSEAVELIYPDKSPTITLSCEVIGQSVKLDAYTFHVRILESVFLYVPVRLKFTTFEERLGSTAQKTGIRFDSDTSALSFLPQPIEDVDYLSYADSKGCTKTIAMNEMQFCKMVMFSPEQYQIRNGMLLLRDGKQFQSHEFVVRVSRGGLRHVQVCLPTFLSRQKMHHSGSPGTAAETLLLVIICFSVILHFLHSE